MRREKAYPLALIAMFAAYSAAWGYISVAKIYSMAALVTDLGYMVQGAYDATHTGILGALNALLTQSALLIYAMALPLGRHVYEGMAILQALWLGAGAFPVFLIARRQLRSGVAALALAAAYLLYFPMAGMNWFDVHRQVLFPTLFMAAYYLYLRGGRSRLAAIPLMVFASTLRFPYEVFPLWLGVVLLAAWAVRGDRPGQRVDLYAGASLAVASLLLIAYNLGFLTAVHFTSPLAVRTFVASSVSQAVHGYLRLWGPSWLLGDYKVPLLMSTSSLQLAWRAPGYLAAVLTVGLYLLPVLGLPLLSRRWAPALLPGLLLIFLSPFPGYHYPLAFKYMYPSTLLAPLWLGTVEAISSLSGGSPRRGAAIAISVLAVTSVTALLFQPYGPLNAHAFNDFELARWTTFNMTYFNDYMGSISLIPRDVPAYLVAAQVNMPELAPRPDAYFLGASCAPYNTFRYVVLDALHGAPTYENYSDACNGTARLNPLLEADWALAHGYGVLAEAGGALVLEANYSGPLELYAPYSVKVPSVGTGLSPVVGRVGRRGPVNVSGLAWPSYTPLFLISGEPVVLPPGLYRATLRLEVCGLRPNDTLRLVVYGYVPAWPGYSELALANDTFGPASLPECTWTEASVEFNVTSVVGYVQVTVEARDVPGWVAVSWVAITQEAPPSPGLTSSPEYRGLS
ncbi:MAG: DUF2079 domain-containing protein [Acidilobus sp.]